MGYTNIKRMPEGFLGWQAVYSDVKIEETEPQLLKAGDFFPECHLMLLNTSIDRKYLGLKDQSRMISLHDIDSRYVLVEMFNELCFECINEVKNYKAFYNHFRSDPQLFKIIKIIGIGAGSSKRNVVKFRKQHQIPFPLFSDSKWYLFSCLGQPALPTSYLLKREASHRYKILFVQNGHIENVNRWMSRIAGIIQKP